MTASALFAMSTSSSGVLFMAAVKRVSTSVSAEYGDDDVDEEKKSGIYAGPVGLTLPGDKVWARDALVYSCDQDAKFLALSRFHVAAYSRLLL